MDRFIGGVLAPAQAHAVTFKIQYGQIYSKLRHTYGHNFGGFKIQYGQIYSVINLGFRTSSNNLKSNMDRFIDCNNCTENSKSDI